MTETSPPPAPTPAASAPRWMRWLLLGSLALNLLVAGLVLGDLLTDGGPGRGPRPVEMALGPLARALDPEDRRAILDSLRGQPGLRPLGREAMRAGLSEIAAAIRAEPFDPARLSAALAAQSGRIAEGQRLVQDAVVARLAALPAEARAAVAERLAADLPPGRP